MNSSPATRGRPGGRVPARWRAKRVAEPKYLSLQQLVALVKFGGAGWDSKFAAERIQPSIGRSRCICSACG